MKTDTYNLYCLRYIDRKQEGKIQKRNDKLRELLLSKKKTERTFFSLVIIHIYFT